MFCFQCEQAAGCKACAGNVGVCGKKADTAELQDKLTGALIGLARATEGNEHVVSDSTAAVIVEGLFATLTNVNFDNDALLASWTVWILKNGNWYRSATSAHLPAVATMIMT